MARPKASFIILQRVSEGTLRNIIKYAAYLEASLYQKPDTCTPPALIPYSDVRTWRNCINQLSNCECIARRIYPSIYVHAFTGFICVAMPSHKVNWGLSHPDFHYLSSFSVPGDWQKICSNMYRYWYGMFVCNFDIKKRFVWNIFEFR